MIKKRDRVQTPGGPGTVLEVRHIQTGNRSGAPERCWVFVKLDKSFDHLPALVRPYSHKYARADVKLLAAEAAA